MNSTFRMFEDPHEAKDKKPALARPEGAEQRAGGDGLAAQGRALLMATRDEQTSLTRRGRRAGLAVRRRRAGRPSRRRRRSTRRRLMQGFPPPPEYRIHIGNWQRWPQKIWSFQHTRELFPTRRLQPVGPVWVLPEARRDARRAAGRHRRRAHDLAADAAATHTDAVLVLHQGRIVEERYLNGHEARDAAPDVLGHQVDGRTDGRGADRRRKARRERAKVGTLLPELATAPGPTPRCARCWT
jgi:hypothetical protein